MKRKTFLAAALAGTAPWWISQPVLAQERGSKAEAKAMVEAAIAHIKKVGAEQGFKDIQTDKATWVKKDLYVFGYDMQGNCKVFSNNDKMLGKNLIDLKDPNGTFILKAFIELASTKGAGWVDYVYADPVTKKLGSKTSYIQKTPGFEGLVGVGVYL